MGELGGRGSRGIHEFSHTTAPLIPVKIEFEVMILEYMLR